MTMVKPGKMINTAKYVHNFNKTNQDPKITA